MYLYSKYQYFCFDSVDMESHSALSQFMRSLTQLMENATAHQRRYHNHRWYNFKYLGEFENKIEVTPKPDSLAHIGLTIENPEPKSLMQVVPIICVPGEDTGHDCKVTGGEGVTVGWWMVALGWRSWVLSLVSNTTFRTPSPPARKFSMSATPSTWRRRSSGSGSATGRRSSGSSYLTGRTSPGLVSATGKRSSGYGSARDRRPSGSGSSVGRMSSGSGSAIGRKSSGPGSATSRRSSGLDLQQIQKRSSGSGSAKVEGHQGLI